MKNAIAIFCAAACLARAAFAATMASQPWTTNRIAEAEARVAVKITAATNGIPRTVLPDYWPLYAVTNRDGTQVSSSNFDGLNVSGIALAATNYTDHALGRFAATGAVANATYATTAGFAYSAGEATSATWAARISDGGSVGADNLTYADILGGFLASTNYTDDVAAEFANGTRSVRYAGYADSAEFSAEAGYVYNKSGNLTYDATDLIQASTNAAKAVVREKSLGGIYDDKLGVWWTPHISGGAFYWTATTNVNLAAGGNE